jgi:hypothetical protein
MEEDILLVDGTVLDPALLPRDGVLVDDDIVIVVTAELECHLVV